MATTRMFRDWLDRTTVPVPRLRALGRVAAACASAALLAYGVGASAQAGPPSGPPPRCARGQVVTQSCTTRCMAWGSSEPCPPDTCRWRCRTAAYVRAPASRCRRVRGRGDVCLDGGH